MKTAFKKIARQWQVTYWCVVSLLFTLYSVSEFLSSNYRITAICTNNGWPSNVKRTEESYLLLLINWGRFCPSRFMWFATSSYSRFISSFNGNSFLRRIPMVGSAPARIGCTSSVESRTVFMVFHAPFCYQRCTI